MSLTPFITIEPIIQAHVIAALVAIMLGPVALYRRRRDRMHKVSGYIWVLSMAVAIGTSFFISSFPMIGAFSPIHLLSILAAWSLWTGMKHIFAGRIRAHEHAMRSLYWTGLLVAGAFNFLPGRMTNRILFPDNPDYGYVLLGLTLAGIAARSIWLRQQRHGRMSKTHILA